MIPALGAPIGIGCGQVFTAQEPDGVGPEKYDETAAAMIAQRKYGSGTPFYRLEQLEGLVPPQRRQCQPMLLAGLHPAHPAGSVFDEQLLDLCPAPSPPWPSHRFLSHPSTSTLDRPLEQVGWSNAYGKQAFWQGSFALGIWPTTGL